MGNMLESDSSTNSDIEITQNIDNIRVRTAGDGMESDIYNSSLGNSGLLDSSVSLQKNNNAVQCEIPQIDTSKDPIAIGLVAEAAAAAISSQEIINRSSSANSVNSKEPNFLLKGGGIAAASPRQMPSRDLLIPLKPLKLEPTISGNKSISSSSSYDKFTAAGVGKQKNPKFVPYEPYSCATRPIVASESEHKLHARKPSDSSSVISQSSAISACESNTSDCNKPVINSTIQSESIGQQTTQQKHRNVHGSGNASTTLIKERLKIAEKEINELQTENARLKKLLVDSIVGATVQTTSLMNQNLVNGNAHGINESFDNLNDELEVWRSKFLSSCVLVEQLTKDNQTLGETVNSAAEIIKDLKLSLSMTPNQYEAVNVWLRQANPLIFPTHYQSPNDINFNSDEITDN